MMIIDDIRLIDREYDFDGDFDDNLYDIGLL